MLGKIQSDQSGQRTENLVGEDNRSNGGKSVSVSRGSKKVAI